MDNLFRFLGLFGKENQEPGPGDPSIGITGGKIDCRAEFIPGLVLTVASKENPSQLDPLLEIIGLGINGFARSCSALEIAIFDRNSFRFMSHIPDKLRLYRNGGYQVERLAAPTILKKEAAPFGVRCQNHVPRSMALR